jgi:hypothetical protein
MGEQEPAARRHLSIYASWRSKHSTVIGTVADTRAEPADERCRRSTLLSLCDKSRASTENSAPKRFAWGSAPGVTAGVSHK